MGQIKSTEYKEKGLREIILQALNYFGTPQEIELLLPNLIL